MENDPRSGTDRSRLARLVVVGSFATILLMVGTLLAIAQLGGSAQVASLAEKSFNIILPVLASWVGTVLAFFFSSQNNERTSNSLDKAIQVTSGVGGGKSAADVMLPLGKIRGVVNLDAEKPGDLLLTELRRRFTGPLSGAESTAVAPVTRLLFVSAGAFRYILHLATLNAFLASRASAEPEKGTLQDLLADSSFLLQVSQLVVFVSATATLRDAKAAMDRVSGAQDIIVTATGNSSEPMIGWISNVDLTKALDGS